MPSAAAKNEKQTSSEDQDPFKSILVIFEKKTRNLEKRKGRLDHLKCELEQGKELNEDQKAAVLKYDQVVETLEFTRDLQKAIAGIMQEHVRACKKAAKREAAERTARETQRIREVLRVQDVLTTLGTPEARQSFLEGTGGALSLEPRDLELLDELYRLVGTEGDGHPSDRAARAADHLVALLDRKNKEVLGTTYKGLRELIQNIEECAYFSSEGDQTALEGCDPARDPLQCAERPQGSEGETGAEWEADRGPSSERCAAAEPEVVAEAATEEQQTEPQEGPAGVGPTGRDEMRSSFAERGPDEVRRAEEEPPAESNNLDFFQESQIDVDLPSADAARPATFVGPEYDPNHPIPTQTFTNQSFAPPERRPTFDGARGGRGPRPGKGYANGRGACPTYGGYQQPAATNGQERFGGGRPHAGPRSGPRQTRGGRGRIPSRRGAPPVAK